MPTRNALIAALGEPKQAITDATHHTIPHTISAFHFSVKPHAAFANPRIAGAPARKKRGLVICPLKLSEKNRTNMETPVAIQIAPIARPIVVLGALSWRMNPTTVNIDAVIIVTGHAYNPDEWRPHCDQKNAT